MASFLHTFNTSDSWDAPPSSAYMDSPPWTPITGQWVCPVWLCDSVECTIDTFMISSIFFDHLKPRSSTLSKLSQKFNSLLRTKLPMCPKVHLWFSADCHRQNLTHNCAKFQAFCMARCSFAQVTHHSVVIVHQGPSFVTSPSSTVMAKYQRESRIHDTNAVLCRHAPTSIEGCTHCLVSPLHPCGRRTPPSHDRNQEDFGLRHICLCCLSRLRRQPESRARLEAGGIICSFNFRKSTLSTLKSCCFFRKYPAASIQHKHRSTLAL